jgi:tetratricopeptide (TPR) repeat protein
MIKHLNKTQNKNYVSALKHKNNGEYEQSIANYKKIIDNDPSNVVYLQELGELYDKLNRPKDTVDCYKKILQIQPNNGVNLNNLGICCYKLSQYESAVEYFKMVLRIKNDIPDVYNNIGNCYILSKKYKLAESALKISLRMREDDNIRLKLGNLYFYTKKYDESIVYYNKIYNKNPDNLYNLCFPHLAKKEFLRGFKLYENRLKNNDIHPQTGQIQRVEIPQIRDWDGVAHCNRLLIIYEQGIGDNIQYYRFIIQLSERYPNMIITYFCKNIISHLFQQYENIVIKTALDNTHDYDYKMFIMSLPHMLKIENILPNKENYIVQNVERSLYWKDKLSSLKKYRVGIVYNGLLSSFIEKFIPLVEFQRLATRFDFDVDIICICKLSEVGEEMDGIDNISFFDIDNNGKPFEDTVAILENIDLLITIDSAIVHLAGIMGIKTWLLLGYGSDWRWSTENTTYWYDSVEILRVTENVELKSILNLVENKLSQLCIPDLNNI